MKKSLTILGFCIMTAIPSSADNNPMMGWSSWNAFRVNISEQVIKRQAFLLDSLGLKAVGYQYVNIDDGFFGYRDPTHGIIPNTSRFPHGLRIVTDYIHSLGLKAGIYSDAGTRTCGSIWDHDENGLTAGLYGHEESDSKVFFRDWNFDFIKVDFCGGQDLGLDERERYSSISKSIHQYGRPDVKYNICRWAFPGTWAEKVADSWRISGDINTNWKSLKYVIDKNLYLSAFARNGKYNDMDMLIVGMKGPQRLQGTGLTDTEDETHFGIWCMMSSPLLIGCDLNKIQPQSLALLKNTELIAINQDPLHLQARVYQHEGDTYVLAKDLLQPQGTTRAVALYNPSDKQQTFRVALSTLELAGKTQVRDLLRHRNLKTTKDSIIIEVAPHGSTFLKLTARTRLEPTRYEAEWAFLPLYDDLGIRKKQIMAAPMEGASGGMGVIHIGGTKDNVIQWNDVYSKQGGNYRLTISYCNEKETRTMFVYVNGEEIKSIPCQPVKGTTQLSLDIRLKQGFNQISIGNPYNWSPDIDKIEVHP